MPAPFVRDVENAVHSGVQFLLSLQDKDGFWREYNLAPGASEAWSTAWVGWCLLADGMPPGTRGACLRAADALASCRVKDGWGYNRKTGPDADTTAWVLRFLSGISGRQNVAQWLSPFIDPSGGVHTFQEPAFGSWSDAHDDVAANAGLALWNDPSSRGLAKSIRSRLLQGFPWQTFWWSTQVYGIAWGLRFLHHSGGVPPQIQQQAYAWLEQLPETFCPFENAHRLMAYMQLNNSGIYLVNSILDANIRGTWPSSTALLVPPHEDESQAQPNSEVRAILTTAICVRVLSEWLQQNAYYTGS
ncbi:MAG TPA: hypothetical protein VF023_02590 [Bryobacteraceae bacterium]|jgi:hypothetical protein